ncbi:carboxymuconolactone decarboxylase family protein [Fictibacillus iocasae]|uniref:Carboxymuconolactone decarboxylase family protein n=1 Tax=Fictibacillus iocasae TaxID=2715437 RepID=A0ABW2NV85_9BACL
MSHHGAALHSLVQDEELVSILKENHLEAPVDEKTTIILKYAVKLTKYPNRITEQDILDLRRGGCSDREILDACQIVSYFNFVNRMADGLGVELETESGV